MILHPILDLDFWMITCGSAGLVAGITLTVFIISLGGERMRDVKKVFSIALLSIIVCATCLVMGIG